MVKLQLMVLGQSRQKCITGPGEHPPCFESTNQYGKWLKAAEKMDGSPPPSRRDWPKEPNYCRDCLPEHRNKMRNVGKCLFPSTIFIEVGEKEEKELVGTSK